MKSAILILVMGSLLATAQADEGRPLMVFQISEAALNRDLSEPIEQHYDVDDTILETRVVGTSHMKGKSRVTLVDNDAGATFKITFEGTASSRTQGHHPPVVVHSRSVTTFKVEKTITIEQLGKVLPQPTTISAQTQTTIEDIVTHRRGPVGRLILRRAGREVAEKQGTASAIGHRNAERRIVAAFDADLAERLKNLEKQVAMRSLVATMLPVHSSPVYRLSTKGDYVNMAVDAQSPDAKTAEIELPEIPFDNQPIHVWVHQSLVAKNIDSALGGLGALRHFMPTLIAAPPAVPRFKGPQWSVVGDWFVIQLSGLDT